MWRSVQSAINGISENGRRASKEERAVRVIQAARGSFDVVVGSQFSFTLPPSPLSTRIDEDCITLSRVSSFYK